MNDYTVTSISTYFVKANSKEEAADIALKAMLGNDDQNILQNGEIYKEAIVVREGTHHTIPLEGNNG